MDGGRDVVPVLAIADFCEAMTAILESGRRSVYNLFNETEPAMRQIVETVLRLTGRRARLVPVPYTVAFGLMRAGEALGVRVPLQSGSLRAMRLNRRRVHESNLRELLKIETSLEEMLRCALNDA